ncbi:SHOCT domain-containing protein [Streptomyces kebangsaanensis]|uniref:SHOCT domain-containing protein n=1 Tax=Streptomyces kebangsaanensis TaxID=864058 RepID=A0ABW6KWF1_9ACTN
MYWYPHGMNGWGWFAMGLGTLLFWALLIAVGVFLLRALQRGPERTQAHDGGRPPTPERLLAERFARGEIDEDEYRRRLDVLRQNSGPPGTRPDPPDLRPGKHRGP